MRRALPPHPSLPYCCFLCNGFVVSFLGGRSGNVEDCFDEFRLLCDAETSRAVSTIARPRFEPSISGIRKERTDGFRLGLNVK